MIILKKIHFVLTKHKINFLIKSKISIINIKINNNLLIKIPINNYHNIKIKVELETNSFKIITENIIKDIIKKINNFNNKIINNKCHNLKNKK